MSLPEPTSAVAAKGSTASTGYEPKTGFGQVALSRGRQEFPWEKLSTKDLGQALPSFSYSTGQRRKFHQAFVSYIRGIDATWIIVNEWRETGGAERLRICGPLPSHTFTPTRNLRARGAAELGGSQSAPSRSPARSPQYGTGHGLMEPTPFGRSIGLAGPVLASQTATGLRVQGFGQNPHGRTGPEPVGRTVTGLGVQGFGRNSRSPSAETAEFEPELESLRTSAASRNLFAEDESEDEKSLHEVKDEIAPQTVDSSVPKPLESKPDISPKPVKPTSSPLIVDITGSKEDFSTPIAEKPLQPKPLQRKPENWQSPQVARMEKEHERLQMGQMLESVMEKMQLMELRHAKESRLRHEREEFLVRELQSQSTAIAQSGAYYGNQPPEEWLLGDALVRDFQVLGHWYNVQEQRPESRRETHLRMRIFIHLRKVLPHEFLFAVRENDVAAIYGKLVHLNTAPAELQRMDVRKKLAMCEKRGRPLLIWLDELYDLFDQLEGLRVPATVQDLRSTFLYSLKDDKRYSEVMTDLMRNPQWDLTRIRMALEAAAYANNDLVAKDSPSGGDAPLSRAQKRKASREWIKPIVRYGQSA